jgi:outer membrane lipoprotein carrier protein
MMQKRGLIIFSKQSTIMFTNIKSLKILLLLLLLQIPFAYAEQKPVTQLKNFLATTKTLTANFKQVVYDETGKVKQTSFGVFNLSRPGKFRWDYQKPFLQEIVSNSGKVWFYDADLEQVTIKKLDKSMGSTPALLLTGDVEIEKEFTMEKQGTEDEMQWIKLLPKNADSSFKYVLIGLNDGVLGGMELSDNFGQLTRIYFSEVVLNPQIKADEFVFNIPKGVDVLEDKELPKPKETVQVKAKEIEQDKVKEAEPVKEPTKETVETQADEEIESPVAVNTTTSKHKSKAKSAENHKENLSAKAKSKDKGNDKEKHKSQDKETKSKDKHKSKDKETKGKDKDKHDDKPKDKHKNKDKSKAKSKDKHK